MRCAPKIIFINEINYLGMSQQNFNFLVRRFSAGKFTQQFLIISEINSAILEFWNGGISRFSEVRASSRTWTTILLLRRFTFRLPCSNLPTIGDPVSILDIDGWFWTWFRLDLGWASLEWMLSLWSEIGLLGLDDLVMVLDKFWSP